MESKETSEVWLSGRTRPVKLDCVLHGLKNDQGLVSFAFLCYDGHPAQFTINSGFINIQRSILGAGVWADGMHAIDFKKVRKQRACVDPGIDVIAFVVCYSMLAHTQLPVVPSSGWQTKRLSRKG